MPSTQTQTRENEIKAYNVYAAEKPAGAAPSRTFTNSASRSSYTGNNMHCARPDAGLKSPNGRVA